MFDQYPSQAFGAFGRAADKAAFDEGLRQHMLRVFNMMALGLGVTGLVAMLVASMPGVTAVLFGTPLKWAVMLAPLAFVMVLSWRFERMSLASLQGTFWAFCGVMGLSMASVFLVFTDASIARTFFVTAAMFAGTSLWGYTTKADLSKMGAFLMMGLIGLILASVVNLFLGSGALHFAISVAGVLIFTGLTAYDVQSIRDQYSEHWGQETNGKLAVMGALSLYLNFVNLFQFLLSLTGQRDD